MTLSIPYSSPDADSEGGPEGCMVAPVESRSIRATEVVYALFVMAAGVLLLASMV